MPKKKSQKNPIKKKMGRKSKDISPKTQTDGQKHIKKIREMQTQTTMRHHLTPVRMVNTKITMAERVGRKENSSTLLLGMKVVAGTIENSMEVPQKTKNRISL